MPPKCTRAFLRCVGCGAIVQRLPKRVVEGGAVFCSVACRWQHHERSAPERFWAYVRKSDSCWEWTGPKSVNGYGRFRITTKNVVPAHRYAWEIVNGPMPAEFDACHSCDNPGCIRPDHVFAGTPAENNADKVAKGRQAVGMRHGSAKLTDDDVRRIRALHAKGTSAYALARRFGVGETAILNIVHRRTWKFLD